MRERSDRLIEIDWRLALVEVEFEESSTLTVEQRSWLRGLAATCSAFAAEEPGWGYAWTQIMNRAHSLLMRSWRFSL